MDSRTLFLHIAQIYLYIINYSLMIVGLISELKGFYLLIIASQFDEGVMALAGISTAVVKVALLVFLMPGVAMIVTGFGGALAAKGKTKGKACSVYSAIMLGLTAANIYFLVRCRRHECFSLFSHICNNIFDFDFELPMSSFTGNVSFEFVVEILALVSALYVYYELKRTAVVKVTLPEGTTCIVQ